MPREPEGTGRRNRERRHASPSVRCHGFRQSAQVGGGGGGLGIGDLVEEEGEGGFAWGVGFGERVSE
jgi:hypothetical protein